MGKKHNTVLLGPKNDARTSNVMRNRSLTGLRADEFNVVISSERAPRPARFWVFKLFVFSKRIGFLNLIDF